MSRGAVLDVLLILLLAAALIFPLFRLQYLDNWGSIESTFIADARFLRDHWPHPRWQPLWYSGTRFDYVYPPALRYGTAALAKWFSLEPVRAYHIYIASIYCLGIAAVYALARIGSRSRAAGWLAAAGTALVSPAFLFLPAFRRDAGWLEPQRLHVLIRYGEGPHVSSIAFLGLALAAALPALRTGGPLAMAAAGVCSALVALHNFYGATALAIFFPILAWSLYITHLDWRVWRRGAGVAALAYGLSAFWLTPSYFRVTLDNLKLVANPGNRWSMWVAAAAALAVGYATFRWARGVKDRAWNVFVWSSLAMMSLVVLGHSAFGLRVAGEPHRLIPELDLVMILAAVELMRRMWRSSRAATRAAAVVLVGAACFSAQRYARHAWALFPEDANWQDRIEYRIQDWIAHNLPGSRCVVTGSTRFWFDTWHDLPQLGGGSDQGLTNHRIANAMWELTLAPKPDASVLWMQAFGIDAVVVNEKRSQDIYRDFVYPQKFAGLLPVLYDSGKGDVIYRVPRRRPGLVRVVNRERAAALLPVRHNYDEERLRPYADLVESGSAASGEWRGTDELRIAAELGAGDAVHAQVTYDPGWRAYSDAGPLPVEKDSQGMILVPAPPGRHNIRLVFELPLENRVGAGLTVTSCVLVLAMVAVSARRRPAWRSA